MSVYILYPTKRFVAKGLPVNFLVNFEIDARTNERTDGRTDGWTDGWTDDDDDGGFNKKLARRVVVFTKNCRGVWWLQQKKRVKLNCVSNDRSGRGD